MNTDKQPIWITLEVLIKNGQTKIIRRQFPKGDLSKEQRLKIAEKTKSIRERAKITREHGTDFRISDGFGV